jgi:predicted nucleic acid-binding protein
LAAFLDTNVLVHCADARAPAKQRLARALVARLAAAGEVVVSTQVLIELFHVLTRKLKVPPATAQSLTMAFTQWPVIDSDVALVAAAVQRSVAQPMSIWDAMVVEAALRARVTTLYSEDFSHGSRFGALAVVDPFVA